MTEWIDVPVADVQTGDEVKVDGYGKPVPAGVAYSFSGLEYYSVVRITLRDVVIDWMQGKGVEPKHVHIRRSSIVAVRRRKPEPSPKPGDWRCADLRGNVYPSGQVHGPAGIHCEFCRVFRASGGWSKDTRIGQPWVMKEFGQASAAPEAYDMVAPVLYGVHDSTGMQQGPGLVPTIYVDTVQYRYLVCAGRAKSIDYVYVDGVQTGSGWAVDHYDRIRPDWRTK